MKKLFKTTRHYFFRSKHYPRGDYNEYHPCRIVRKGFVERGWYVNSFYKVSRFSGVKLGLISFGLISGYRNYRIPYLAFHWGNYFFMPVGLLPFTQIKWITCWYSKNNWTSHTKLLLARMKREQQKISRT